MPVMGFSQAGMKTRRSRRHRATEFFNNDFLCLRGSVTSVFPSRRMNRVSRAWPAPTEKFSVYSVPLW